MIFVTVGTHEQQFNRLVKYMDNFSSSKVVNDDIIIQTGYSTYVPQHCEWKKFFPYQEIEKNVARARIVITHGGPSSFIMPLRMGKIPIVVPRQKKFEEHVNDHQLEFCEAVALRQKKIIVLENVEELAKTIINYNNMISQMENETAPHNNVFCMDLEKIMKRLCGDRYDS